jgi:uncharacterized protein (DUF697 family)
MNKELVRGLGHLGERRRAIVAHAAAAALAGFVPVPFFDEQLPALVKRAMIRRIAEGRGVTLDEDAVRELAEGRVARPSWRDLVGLGALARSARRSVRTLFLAYGVYRRAEAASQTFALGTLFDHYCAQHHVGVGLDAVEAHELRGRIERAIASGGGTLGGFAFRRGFAAALRATVRAPLELVRALTWRRARRRLAARPAELEAEEVLEETLATVAADEKSFLGRATAAVDRQLSTLGDGWVGGLVAAFDASSRK